MRSSLALLLIPLALGCKAEDSDPTLQRFSSCDAMQRYMRDVAKLDAQSRFSVQIGGGFNEYALSSDSASKDDSGEAGGATSYSTTNTQESSVDEDDLMKTDGTYLYVLSGSSLTVSRAFPTEDAGFLASVEVGGTPEGIYLVDDYVIALSRVTRDTATPPGGAAISRDSDAFTLATFIDVSDPSAPVVVRETYASGEFQESRRIDDTLYVVTYEYVDVISGASTLTEAKRLIKDTTAERWLPWRLDAVASGPDWKITEGKACDCEDVSAAEAETGTFLTNVLALDLADPLSEFAGEAVVGRADAIYASSNAIYLGWSEWSDTESVFVSVDDSVSTIIHKFDISSGDAHPAYLATAKIDGTLSGEQPQFSFSEYAGVLRVATTEIDEDWNSSSTVWALEEADGVFTELDRVSGIAPLETIFAARFVGDLGYIVTYEQNWGDPLFTLDLSDPTDLKVAGELAVTGFSSYLHPMDSGHLLSVGMDDSGTGSWQLAVSLFDVTDLSSPKLSDRIHLDSSDSESSWEHHAFNYFADKEVLAIPMTTWDGESVLSVIHATTGDLEPIGELSQSAVVEASGLDAWCVPVRRSVVMDDDIWAISEAGLSAAAISDPATVKASVPFVGTASCSGDYYGEEW